MKTKPGASPKEKAARLFPRDRLFPDEWLLQFDDPYDRIYAVALRYLNQVKTNDGTLKPAHHIEAAMLGKQFIYREGLPLMAGFPNFQVGGISPQACEYIVSMHEWIRNYAALRMEREATEAAEALDEHFEVLLDRNLGYELTAPQLIQLRRFVNELQARISITHTLPEHRRERLLRRMEKLQLELHSKLSSLDRLYGTTMEIIAVAQNLGEEAKAVIDIAGKIFGIIWAVHSRRDGNGASQTIVPFPLPPPERFEIPIPLPLPFAVAYARVGEGGG